MQLKKTHSLSSSFSFFFSFDIILLSFWATPAKVLHFLHLRAWATSCRALQKTLLFWICCKNSPLFSNLLWKLLSYDFAVRNFSLLDLLERTSLLWICLWELLLSSGFCCENFSLLDFAVRTVSPLGKQAQTLHTFQVRNHSWTSMSVCCIPPHCKLPASNLLAPSEATTFQIILLPLLLPCTKSFLNRPSSLVSAPNTTTRPRHNPP